MSIATPKNIEQEGFDSSQFGSPPDWAVPGGYLQNILDAIAIRVRMEVGSDVYDAAAIDGTAIQQYHYVQIASAEAAYASAELWPRLEKFERSTIKRNSAADGVETIGSRLLKNAEAATLRGDLLLSTITGNVPDGAFAVGGVVSNHFEAVT